MNRVLKQRLEEIAQREGPTFTELLQEAAWDLVARRERPWEVIDLPVVDLAGAATISADEMQRRIDESEDDYFQRKATVRLDRPA